MRIVLLLHDSQVLILIVHTIIISDFSTNTKKKKKDCKYCIYIIIYNIL